MRAGNNSCEAILANTGTVKSPEACTPNSVVIMLSARQMALSPGDPATHQLQSKFVPPVALLPVLGGLASNAEVANGNMA